MDEMTGPADDAYGRATAPERYEVLHGAADDLLNDLVDHYDVSTSSADAADFPWTDGSEVVRAVRLRPSLADAAPLVCGFTAFPGLLVQLGEWHGLRLPHCGCDACDEDPIDLIRELHEKVEALAEGRFREELNRNARPRLSAEFVSADGSRTSNSLLPLDPPTARNLDGSGRRDWKPWPPRSSP